CRVDACFTARSDRSWVMLRALRQYLQEEGAGLTEDAESLAELDRGESVSIEDSIREVRKIIRRPAKQSPREARRSTAKRLRIDPRRGCSRSTNQRDSNFTGKCSNHAGLMSSSFAAFSPRIARRSASLKPGVARMWSTAVVVHGKG